LGHSDAYVHEPTLPAARRAATVTT
jgi:hypothetical protein